VPFDNFEPLGIEGSPLSQNCCRAYSPPANPLACRAQICVIAMRVAASKCPNLPVCPSITLARQRSKVASFRFAKRRGDVRDAGERRRPDGSALMAAKGRPN
jgi:hypothetical protein